MTGLSEQNRADFNLMKEIDQVVQPDAGVRLQKSKQLIEKFLENKFTKQLMDEWQLSISTNPLVCEGIQLNAGNLIFGDNKKVSLGESGNLHRDGQGQMFIGGNLGNIVVFYEQRNNNDCRKFVDMLK